MQNEKIILGKEIAQYPYRDLCWRSYFSEIDGSFIIRKFRNPFQGSLDFYKKKFIEEHIALLVLSEFKLAPEAEVYVEGDDVYYRHKHIVLFQHKPQWELIQEFRSKMEAMNFVMPPDFSFTRLGLDISDGQVKTFRLDDLIFSHLPLEELLVKIQPKVHGLEVSEFLLMAPLIKVAESYPSLLECVAEKNWMFWVNHYLSDFLDLATTDLYLQESKNIPLLKRIQKIGGIKIRKV